MNAAIKVVNLVKRFEKITAVVAVLSMINHER